MFLLQIIIFCPVIVNKQPIFPPLIRGKMKLSVKSPTGQLTGGAIYKYTPPMNVFFRKNAALFAAMLALCISGCAKAPAPEDTLVQLTAPTVAPVVTPVPTPVATPTPIPTQKPAPRPTDSPEKAEAKATAAPTQQPKASANTPYADSYSPVELKEYSRKIQSFSAQALDGSTITEEYFSGGRLTLVNIWTTT